MQGGVHGATLGEGIRMYEQVLIRGFLTSRECLFRHRVSVSPVDTIQRMTTLEGTTASHV